METKDQNPLRWPDGWERTRIQDRKRNAAWKKNFKESQLSFLAELGRMAIGDVAIGEVIISFNHEIDEARRDPGVAVYFSKFRKPDYSWLDALDLDTPVPTLTQINDAFQKRAMACHPDRYPDDPAKAELFVRLTNHRQRAIDWIKGTQRKQHDYVIACDKFEEVRLNFMALRGAVAAFRTIERVGVPGILEHTLHGFKTALPAHVEEEVNHAAISS